MTIKEFDEKVRIGSWVRLKGDNGHPFRVVDIDRRTHEAISFQNRRIRCSELVLVEKKGRNKL